MNPELKEKWVKALRSGEYKQTFGRLRQDNSYCCLGVLCKVADFAIDDTGGDSVQAHGSVVAYGPVGNAIGGKPVVEHLWRMNDDAQMSFSQIADYIEQNL